MAFTKKYNRAILSLVVALAILGVTGSSWAGFIDTGQGARPVAMGRAFTAVSDDIHAMFYNPAGMAQLKGLAATTMYARLYPGVSDVDLNYGLLAAAVPLSFLGKIGVGVTNLSLDMYKENMFYISYGRSLPFNVSVGGSFKMLRWSADGDTDPITGARDNNYAYNGFSIDAGVMYQVPTSLVSRFLKSGRLQLGMMLKDVNQPSIAENGSDSGKLPLGMAFGVAYLSEKLILAGDFSKVDEFSKLHVGAEYVLQRYAFGAWKTAFTVRGGGIHVMSDAEGGEADFGFGLMVRALQIDYAYVYPMALKNVDGSHKISLMFSF
ncbi:MAG: type IX secretion system membrane protein PorP/SprF [Candidatus Zhuqueibacterota bacterium]